MISDLVSWEIAVDLGRWGICIGKGLPPRPLETLGGVTLPVSVLAWIAHMIFFHVLCFLLHLADRLQILQQFKFHRGDTLTYWDLLPRVVVNQIFIMLPAMFLSEWLGLCFRSMEPQGLLVFLLNSVFMSYGHDVVFYIGHRFLLHSRWGYRGLGHDVHHSTKGSVAISSMYMAPLDFFLEIILPYLLPLCLISRWADFYFVICAPALGGLGGLYEHSGFNFWPGVEFLNTTAHTMHHTRYSCSFSDGVGSANMMDNVFKTTYRHYGYQTIPQQFSKKVVPSEVSTTTKIIAPPSDVSITPKMVVPSDVSTTRFTTFSNGIPHRAYVSSEPKRGS